MGWLPACGGAPGAGPGAVNDPKIQAVIGLGNPGPEYQATRHNVGYWFVDAMAHDAHATLREERKLQGLIAQAECGGQRIHLFKPTTFMNHSGRAVRALAAYFKLPTEALLVVHDDLDLPPGTARLKCGGGHGGHNGLRDIICHLGPDFARLRLGIGHPGQRERVLKHVLNRFTASEEQAVLDAVDQARGLMPVMLEQGWQKAVQRLHTAGG